MTGAHAGASAAAAATDGPSARSRGRRAGDPDRTRTEILAAARREFARLGFAGTSVRAVARAAGIDPALIAHHFGTKRELFLAVHQIPSDPSDLIGPALGAPDAQRGEELARAFLERFLGDPAQSGVSLIRCAATDSGAADLLRGNLEAAFTGQAPKLMPGVDETDAGARAALISSMLVGVIFHARVLQVEPLASHDPAELARRIGPAIQTVLNSPRQEAGSPPRAALSKRPRQPGKTSNLISGITHRSGRHPIAPPAPPK